MLQFRFDSETDCIWKLPSDILSLEVSVNDLLNVLLIFWHWMLHANKTVSVKIF